MEPYPTPSEAAVMLAWDLLRSEDLPDLAALWVAGGAEGEALAELAGAPRYDGRVVDELWGRARLEVGAHVPGDADEQAQVVIRFELARWQSHRLPAVQVLRRVQRIAVDLPSSSALRLDVVYLDDRVAGATDDGRERPATEAELVAGLLDLQEQVGPRTG